MWSCAVFIVQVFNLLPSQPHRVSIQRLHLLVNEETSHTLSSTNTHAGKQDLLLLPPALRQTRHDLASTCCSERVTESNCATADVHLGVVDAQLVQAVHGHGGEGLVELEDVDLIYKFSDDDPFFSEASNFIDVVEGKNYASEEVNILSSFEDACKTYEFTWAIRNASEKTRKLPPGGLE